MTDPGNPWAAPGERPPQPAPQGVGAGAPWPTAPTAGWMPPPVARGPASGSPVGLVLFVLGAVVTVAGLALPYYGITLGFGLSASVHPLHYGANAFALLLQMAALVFVVLSVTRSMPLGAARGLGAGLAVAGLALVVVRLATISNPLGGLGGLGDLQIHAGLRYGAVVYAVGSALYALGALVATMPGSYRAASRVPLSTPYGVGPQPTSWPSPPADL